MDRRIRPLDGIRALAVLAVLATHAGIPFLPGGFVGVDVFFVLSGFLITSLLFDQLSVTGRIDLGGFWTRRARRLLPAALVMIVAVVAARPLFVPDSVAALRGDAIATALWSGNWRWALQGTNYFAQGGTPSPLQHTWSLAVEEQFYLVWPLLILACRAASRRRLLAVSLAGVAASAVATYVLARVASPGRVYFGTDTRAQELLVGAALAALLAPTWRWLATTPSGTQSPQPAGRRPVPLLLSVCGLAVLTGIATVADGAPSEFRHGLLLLTALAAAALVAGVVLDSGQPVARLLSTRLMVGIGRISYGLYLWHWPVYLALDGERTGLHGYVLAALRVGVTGVLAGASFVLIERPAQRVKVRPRRVLPAAATAVAVVVAISAWTTPAPSSVPRVALTSPPSSGFSVPPLLVKSKLASRLHVAVPRAISRHGPLKVAVFGDSVSLTLMLYMPQEPGIEFTDYSVLGCGIATGGPFLFQGQLWPDNRKCDAWPRRWLRQLRVDRPDEVLLLVGRWEMMDRFYQGQWQHPGDPAYDDHLAALLSQAITLLGSTGARVIVSTALYNRGGEQPDGSLYPEDIPNRVTVWNRLVRTVVAAHPGTHLLNLNRKLCPNGTFTWTVDGIQVRSDGVHLTQQGVQWLAPWLVRQLFHAARV
ncbi:MAG TPA: acyltransferase family protein [Streptosporangiaceae bacterium]|nr:acyltransferase family protein [Streptosporangiaceae bacterium]